MDIDPLALVPLDIEPFDIEPLDIEPEAFFFFFMAILLSVIALLAMEPFAVEPADAPLDIEPLVIEPADAPLDIEPDVLDCARAEPAIATVRTAVAASIVSLDISYSQRFGRIAAAFAASLA